MNIFVTAFVFEKKFVSHRTTLHTDFNENTVDTITSGMRRRKKDVKMFSREMFLCSTKSVCALIIFLVFGILAVCIFEKNCSGNSTDSYVYQSI